MAMSAMPQLTVTAQDHYGSNLPAHLLSADGSAPDMTNDRSII